MPTYKACYRIRPIYSLTGRDSVVGHCQSEGGGGWLSLFLDCCLWMTDLISSGTAIYHRSNVDCALVISTGFDKRLIIRELLIRGRKSRWLQGAVLYTQDTCPNLRETWRRKAPGKREEKKGKRIYNNNKSVDSGGKKVVSSQCVNHHFLFFFLGMSSGKSQPIR